jgi:hypothetical protein
MIIVERLQDENSCVLIINDTTAEY